MAIVSFLGLLILASFHNVIYLLIALVSLIYLICYLNNNESIVKDRLTTIAAIILEVICGLHFVLLWSNLVVVQNLSQTLHVPAAFIIAICALIIGAFSFNGAIVLINMLRANLLFLAGRVKDISKKRLGFEHLVYLLFCLTMIITISFKSNYHLDEMMSYGLANHKDGIYMSFEEGVKYEPAAVPYLEYLTTAPEHRFDYDIAYANQESDVHPPLYYILLHTICSIFPGVFSKWSAGFINIVFGVAIIVILNGMVMKKGIDNKVRYLVLITFAVSAGILNAIAFFRMYVMTMFLCILLLKMILDGVDKDRCDYHFYGKLGVVLLTGAMTHYYIIIYAAILFTAYGGALIAKKRWTDVGGLVISSGIAAAFAVLIFPRMLFHMFTGYRGEEALENVSSYGHSFVADFGKVLISVDHDLTGRIGFILLAFCAVLLLIKRVRPAKNELIKYMLIFVPVIIYCGAILRLAGRIENRYFYPVYAVFFFMIVVEVVYLIDLLLNKYKVLVIAFVLIAVLIGGYLNYDWEYLYRDTVKLSDFSAENADLDCLYIYRDRWMVQPSFVEARNYKSITFVRGEHMDMLPELEISDDDKLVVIMAEVDHEDTKEKILKAFHNLSTEEFVGNHSLGKTYIFR